MTNRSVFVVVLLGGALALGQTAMAQESPFRFTQFSATQVMTAPGGNAMPSTKIYRSGDKLRMDLPQMGNGGYVLTALSEHTTYMVMGSGMCMEMHRPDAKRPNPFAMKGKVQRTSLGSDTINGHPVKIEQITVDTGSGNPVTMKAWEATDLKGFPVRVEVPSAQGTMRIDYEDVNLSAPPASLFATPTNCREMPMMPGRPQ